MAEPQLTEWEERMQRLEEDYELGRMGWTPSEVMFAEEWEQRDRAARHYDAPLRQPERVSDDWVDDLKDAA